MLAVKKMAKEFAKKSNVDHSVKNTEALKIPTHKTEEAMLLGKINVTLGGQQKSSYRLADAISSSEARNVLIVTRGRSGSSFVGSLIAQYPGTFYSFEPLNWDGIKGKEMVEKINFMKRVFDCVPEQEFIEFSRGWNLQLVSNFRLQESCDKILQNLAACFIPEVYHSVCSVSPIRLIKTIRLPYEEANTLLMDPEIGRTLKVIFLFRDQRGVLQSMKSKVHWCKDQGRCKISDFCNESQADVNSALSLKIKYPGEIMLLSITKIV